MGVAVKDVLHLIHLTYVLVIALSINVVWTALNTLGQVITTFSAMEKLWAILRLNKKFS